jgi:hypothetical protein
VEPVTVNFAMTREDFIASRTAQLKLLMPQPYRFAIKFMGAVLIGFAAVLLAAGHLRYRPAPWLGALLAVCGVFLFFMYLPTVEASARKHAANDFDAGRCGPPARKVCFGENSVEIRSERYQAKIPYEMFYSAYEDGSVFLLYTGIGECRSVPKRTMNGEERKRVADLLGERLKRKFKQEGTREWTK